jgi:hypothetical protein
LIETEFAYRGVRRENQDGGKRSREVILSKNRVDTTEESTRVRGSVNILERGRVSLTA